MMMVRELQRWKRRMLASDHDIEDLLYFTVRPVRLSDPKLSRSLWHYYKNRKNLWARILESLYPPSSS